MKHRNFLKNSIMALIPSALAIGALLGCYKASVLETDAYSASSLPTTIDLNAVEDSAVRTYYSSVSGKKGNNLLIELKKVLSNGQKYYSYDSGDAIWRMYEITDRDWEKSPANRITNGTYNSTTNTISNYTYKTTDPYVRALYVNRDAENPKTAWASHGERNKANTIEREHIWPKSHGFDSGTAAGARGDPMHLWAADGTANGMHSNLFYGYVDKSKSYKDAGNTHDILWGNLTGTSKTIGSGTVFEPQDCDKGDIARACFYMVARYNNLAGNDNNISGANPNLTLSTNLSENSATGTSTPTQAYSLGLLQDLLEWNKIDPVDDYEIKRNDLLYRNFTNNRNPFIDYPQWADIIWGNETSTASPSSDELHGGEVAPTAKKVSSIEITSNPTKVNYTVGEKFSSNGMVVTAHYSDGSSEAVSNYTIDKTGNLTAADKLITISFGGKTTSIRIYVTVPQGGSGETSYTWDLVSENQSDWTGTYILGSGTDGSIKIADIENFQSGLFNVLDATVTNGVLSGENVKDANAVVISPSTNSGKYIIQAGSKYIGKTANSNGVDASTETKYDNSITFANNKSSIVGAGGRALTYLASNANFKYYAASNNCLQLFKKTAHSGGLVHPTSISLDSSLDLNVGEKATLEATVNPENVSDNSVNWSSNNQTVAIVDEFGQVTAVGAGTATITATANDTTGNIFATCTVTVTEVEILSSITVSGSYKTQYFIGDPFVADDITVTAHFTRGGVETRTQDVTQQAEFDGFSSDTTGTKTISVVYDTVSTSFDVTVSEIPTEENTVTFVASQYEFDNGQSVDSLTKDDFVITTGGNVKYYDSGSALRAYGGSSLTISGPKKIIRVSFVFAGGEGSNTISVNTGTCNSSTGYWENSDGVDVLTFSIGGTSGHRRIQQIVIKYDDTSDVIATLESISLSGNYQTTFYTGKQFSYEGLVVTAHYSNTSTNIVTPTSVSGYDLSNAGVQTITVSYTENEVTKTATYNINVVATALSSVEIVGSPKTSFNLGEEFTHAGAVVEAVYNSGDRVDVTSEATWNSVDTTVAGQKTVRATYNNKSDTYSITVNPIYVETQVEYTFTITKDDFTTVSYADNNKEHTSTATCVSDSTQTKLVTWTSAAVMQSSANGTIQLQKSNGVITSSNLNIIKSVTINSTAGTFTTSYSSDGVTFDKDSGAYFKIAAGSSTAGQVTSIVVTFADITRTPVNALLKSISLNTSAVKKNYLEDEVFESTNLVVTATYTDNSTAQVSPTSITGFNSTVFGQQTITVSYTEGTITKTATYNVNVIEREKTTYEKANSRLISGTYLIGFGDYFMSSDLISNKLGFETFTNTDDSVVTYHENVVWKVEDHGQYYTMKNSEGLYLAAATAKNTVEFVSEDVEAAHWTIENNSDNYVIKSCVARDDGAIILRGNSADVSYFSCYVSNSALNKLSFYRVKDTAFVKASSLDWIQDGDVITFGVNNKAISLDASDHNGAFFPSATMTEGSTLYSIADKTVLTFKVEIDGSNYSFKSERGYLAAAGDNTSFTFVDEITTNAQFQIVNNKFQCVGINNRYINGNDPRIGMYTTNSSYHVDVYILKEFGEGYKWSEKFLDDTYNCVTTSWSTYGDMYDGLSAQGKLTICCANNNEFGRIEEQAIARYDYMISDGWATDEFLKADGHEITRTGRQSFSLFGLNSEDINSETILLILIVTIGVVAASSFAVISKKHRKEF